MLTKKIHRLAALFAVPVLLIAGCGPKAAETVPSLVELSAVTFDTTTVNRGTFSMKTAYPGALSPRSTEVYFDVSGTIDEVPVYTGMYVEAGDLLMTLDRTALDEAIESTAAEIETLGAEAGFDAELNALERQRLLTELEQIELTEGRWSLSFKKKSLEIEAFDLACSQDAEMLENTLAELNTKLIELNEETALLSIRAPHEGYVYVAEDAVHGAFVKNGKTVVSLIDTSSIELVIDSYITEHDFERSTSYALINGQQYDVTPDPIPEDVIMAKTLAGEPIRGAFFVNDPEKTLTPGLYGVLVTETKHEEDALQIPTNTILNDSEGTYVYRITDNGSREKVYIRTGSNNVSMTVVKEGLEEGDEIYVPE